MVITIAVSVRGQRARVALLKGDRLSEYAIWLFDQPGDIGDIYAGRITARMPAMAGSFVDLGDATGFLPDSAGGFSEGDGVTVEIIRCAQSGKGPRVAARPEECRRKPGLIRQGLGPLGDLAARYPGAPIEIDSYALIAALSANSQRGSLAGRLKYKPASFDPVLEDEVAALAEPTATLGGARMHVTPTPALTAIDIDAGAASGEKSAKPDSQLGLNTVLIPELARQIVLRNLSGGILVDFAGMKSAARPKLLPALVAALREDPLQPRCLGFSHLGFAEISRKRVRPPLHEALA